jgi:hypothetical protein
MQQTSSKEHDNIVSDTYDLPACRPGDPQSNAATDVGVGTIVALNAAATSEHRLSVRICRSDCRVRTPGDYRSEASRSGNRLTCGHSMPVDGSVWRKHRIAQLRRPCVVWRHAVAASQSSCRMRNGGDAFVHPGSACGTRTPTAGGRGKYDRSCRCRSNLIAVAAA